MATVTTACPHPGAGRLPAQAGPEQAGDLKPLRPKCPLRANRNCGKKFADLQLGAFLEFDNLDSEAERLPVRV